ncbi:MAG TPA: hypothetical protein VFV01_47940 [Spirillospora sp.]|nr:hypothetical protein [Spirillospora sp.]
MRTREVTVGLLDGPIAEAMRYGLLSAWHAHNLTDDQVAAGMKLVDRIDEELQP